MMTLIFIAVVIGIEIAMILAILRTAENTQKTASTLEDINNKLSKMVNMQGGNTNSWVCKCGTRNYGSKICSKCGASKDSR